MSIHEYKQIIDHITVSHKSQHPFLLKECEKQITSTNLKCYCKHLKITNNNKLQMLCIRKCSQVCGFCQYSDEWLANCILDINISTVKTYFSVPFFVKRYNTLNIVFHNIHNIFTNNDVLQMLELDLSGNIFYPAYLIQNILAKHSNKESFAVIKKLLHAQHVIDKNLELFNQFVFNVVQSIVNSEHNVFSQDIGQIVNSESFVRYVIGMRDDNIIIWTIQNSLIVWNNSFASLGISQNVINHLIKKGKITNLIGFISQIYKKTILSVGNVLYITVAANDIFHSMFQFNPNDKIITMQMYPLIKIVYKSVLNDIGFDAGGLTRDFFTNVTKQMVHYFDLDENGFYNVTNLPVTADVFYLMGNLMCRSIFGEQIMPAIRFHPMIIVLMFIEYYKNHKSDYPTYTDIKEFLLHFDIDYINNLFKIEDFSQDELIEFFTLSEDPDFLVLPDNNINKKTAQTYIIKTLIENHTNLNTKYIAMGFGKMLNAVAGINNALKMQINLLAFYLSISGEQVYNITGTGEFSLESCLFVENCTVSATDSITTEATNNKKCQVFKKYFISVLDELSKTDKDKLKELLKFWFGTYSISNFRQYNPTIKVMTMPDFVQCFKSSTCSGTLYCNTFFNLVQNKYNKFINDTINATIENQKLCEEAGLYMQLM